MKTHQEISIEARRLEVLGGTYVDDVHRISTQNQFFPPRIVMGFSDIRPRVGLARDRQESEAPSHVHRWIEVAMIDGVLEYRLLEGEVGDGGGSAEPELVLGSDSAFDVLAEGYELEESERLGEALTPFMESMEEDEFADSAEPSSILEIEQIVSAGELTPGERMHTRADIVAFLEGQLGPSEFIAAVVGRHRRRQNETETISESRAERLCVDTP